MREGTVVVTKTNRGLQWRYRAKSACASFLLLAPKLQKLKSVRVHFAPGKIAITLELLGQFRRFLDQNDHHSLGVLLIY